MRDPVVEKVRKKREAYAARFNFDVDAIFEDLKKRERESGQAVVILEPKRLAKISRRRRTHS